MKQTHKYTVKERKVADRIYVLDTRIGYYKRMLAKLWKEKALLVERISDKYAGKP